MNFYNWLKKWFSNDVNWKVKVYAFKTPPFPEITSIIDQYVSSKSVPSIAEGKEN